MAENNMSSSSPFGLSPESNDQRSVSQIVLLICKQGGETTFSSLLRHREFQKEKEFCHDLLMLLERFSSVFHLSPLDNNDYLVTVVTKVELCEDHTSHHGCSRRQCEKMHLCVFYLLGTGCGFGGKCSFGHDITCDHNRTLLYRHNLELLDDQLLHIVFRKNRFKQTLPQVCRFYNVVSGCRPKNEGDRPTKQCNNLHICSHYLADNCKFGQGCKRSHNVYDIQPKRVLEKFAISTDGNPDDTVRELRSLHKKVSDKKDCEGLSDKLSSSHLTDDDDDKIEEICTYYLRGNCAYGQVCKKYHKDQPYQWQYKKDSGWIDFGDIDNASTEENYCDVKKGNVYVKIDGYVYEAVFNKMSCESNCDALTGPQIYEMRRLSTPSAVTVPASHLFTTKWMWFWKDGQPSGRKSLYEWCQYGEQGNVGNQAEVTSDELEQQYLKDIRQTSFKTDRFSYIIHFDEMKQKNNSVGTERDIRRRPVFVTEQDVLDMKRGKRIRRIPSVESGANQESLDGSDSEKKRSTSADIPDHWNMECQRDNIFFQLVPVSSVDPGHLDEYVNIATLFHKTLPTYQIQSIKRIQNMELWEDFTRMKRKMDRRQTSPTTEMLLFHGATQSSEVTNAICQQGFDCRISGSRTSRTSYGKGSYFAKKAKLSNRYIEKYVLRNSNGIGRMFAVRVLVGSYARGDQDMVRPPPKDHSKPLENLYDSCVDKVNNPTIFVIFDRPQAYPEYLIEYKL